jgi:hypothetical protein
MMFDFIKNSFPIFDQSGKNMAPVCSSLSGVVSDGRWQCLRGGGILALHFGKGVTALLTLSKFS